MRMVIGECRAPIRYRVAREFLKDKKTTMKIESESLTNAAV